MPAEVVDQAVYTWPDVLTGTGRAVRVLSEVLGPRLPRRYTGETALRADITTPRREDEAEPELSTIEDTDHIAAAMVTLGAAPAKAIDADGRRRQPPPMTRGAARMTADAADILWSHSGDDSGG